MKKVLLIAFVTVISIALLITVFVIYRNMQNELNEKDGQIKILQNEIISLGGDTTKMQMELSELNAKAICDRANYLKWNAFKEADITPRRLDHSIEDDMNYLTWGLQGYKEGAARGEDWADVIKDYEKGLGKATPIYSEYLRIKEQCESQ